LGQKNASSSYGTGKQQQKKHMQKICMDFADWGHTRLKHGTWNLHFIEGNVLHFIEDHLGVIANIYWLVVEPPI